MLFTKDTLWIERNKEKYKYAVFPEVKNDNYKKDFKTKGVILLGLILV